MKPGGPQSIRWPVLDENSKERFSKERPHPDQYYVCYLSYCLSQNDNDNKLGQEVPTNKQK